MTPHRKSYGVLVVAAIAACAPPPPTTPAAATLPPPSVETAKLVVLLAESATFPKAAQATNESLIHAQLDGGEAVQVSKVSLEVAQLAIECVEPSVTCYAAVGRSLSAKDLLFAQIAAVKRAQLKVTITLFDVDTKTPRTRAEKVFSSENEATAGIAELVAK